MHAKVSIVMQQTLQEWWAIQGPFQPDPSSHPQRDEVHSLTALALAAAQVEVPE